ncbi:hypothetical protein AAFF_G00318970 [Aldrovandia affinis]|uniref:Uncharacterized protein n=1 Tax=Aldrovandia affinis TaxID=143900 RepID=A0AAD7SMQ8_9TELE|nr:hypothetical protein AAFF_G00318970 [Aldrovandia affinis]
MKTVTQRREAANLWKKHNEEFQQDTSGHIAATLANKKDDQSDQSTMKENQHGCGSDAGVKWAEGTSMTPETVAAPGSGSAIL